MLADDEGPDDDTSGTDADGSGDVDGSGADGGDDGGGGSDGDSYSPPTREQWDKVQAALARANAEARQHRLLTRKLRDEQAAERRKGESEHEAELREAREKAAGEVEARYKPLLVRGAAARVLVEAGAVLADAAGKPLPGRLDKLLRLLDLGQLEVGDDGSVSGLDDQVKELKEGFPEFFEARGPTKARPKADAADRKPEAPKGKSSAERLAASWSGGQ